MVAMMDYLTPSCLGFSLIISAFIYFLTKTFVDQKVGSKPLPPGPWPFPIIGNILLLGKKPHQSVANLSKTYGPIMTLKLGSITTIIISSPELAKEVLQKHDLALSSRAIPDTVRATDHSKLSLVWLPVSAPWRALRKACTLHMFTAQRLDAGQPLRRQKVQDLLDYVQESCAAGQAIDVGQTIFTTVLNLISNTFFSVDLAQYRSDLSQSFRELTESVFREIGASNIVDYFPALRLLDPQQSRKRMTVYIERMFEVFDRIINERLKLRGASSSMNSNESNKDLLDSLLNVPELSLDEIKHLLLDLFFAGTDTSTVTVEWAMAELLRKPEILAKAQAELRGLLGKDGKVEEFEISNFPYLQAIVKETFRLHPAGPFLVPHKAETGVEICGFSVPKGSKVLVNVWAMARDSNVWPDNPDTFMPERFLNCGVDVKGRDFELIPFGSGRRICPGMPLAHRMIHLMLASLLYAFDWKLADGLKPEDLAMTDEFGLTLHLANPLLAIPIKV